MLANFRGISIFFIDQGGGSGTTFIYVDDGEQKQ